MPRASRRTVQLFVTVASILVALAATVLNWSTGDGGDGRRRLARPRRTDVLHVDDPARVRCGVVPALRGAHIENSPFAPSAAAVPGTPAEQEAIELKAEHTEVFPLALFALVRDDAVPGVERPDHHVRGPGDPVAAALPALRAGPAASAAVPGGGAEVLPARRAVLGVLPLRSGAAVRLHRLVHLSEIDDALRNSPQSRACCWPGWGCSASGCCSSSARCRSTPGPRTCTPARPPRSPPSWPPAPRSPRSAR